MRSSAARILVLVLATQCACTEYVTVLRVRFERISLKLRRVTADACCDGQPRECDTGRVSESLLQRTNGMPRSWRPARPRLLGCPPGLTPAQTGRAKEIEETRVPVAVMMLHQGLP